MKVLSARDADQLIKGGGIDVIDVREPHEFEGGHVPGARNVPLGELKANPKAGLPRDRVLLVCAAGSRSTTAAELADGLGLKEVFALDGGTRAWTAQKLPLEDPPPPPAAAPKTGALDAVDPSCAMPDPGLDSVVGANMKELRAQKGLSLDQLARTTGLSRTLLGQIELGKTTASVDVVWRIAQALDVHFSAMLSKGVSGAPANQVLRAAGVKRLVRPDNRYSSRALYPLGDKPAAEFYELFLAGHSREDAQPHAPGTRENLIVTAGRLELNVGPEHYELGKGDAVVFAADVAHSYVNPGKDECWMYLVMTYA